MTSRQWAAFLALTVIWGSSFLWIKIAVAELDPVSLSALRLCLGAIGLAVFYLMARPGTPRGAGEWASLIVLGVLGSSVPWILIGWAEITIDSSMATILNATVPLFTVVLAHFFLDDERFSAGRVLGLLLGFAGIVVLVGRSGGAESAGGDLLDRRTLGRLAMLVSSFIYASGGVLARRKLRSVDPMIVAVYPLALGNLGLAMGMAAAGRPVVLPTSTITWLAVVYLGVPAAGIAYWLYFYLLRGVGPTRASMVTYAVPVIGVALGVAVLGEQVGWQFLFGSLLVLASIWVVNKAV